MSHFDIPVEGVRLSDSRPQFSMQYSYPISAAFFHGFDPQLHGAVRRDGVCCTNNFLQAADDGKSLQEQTNQYLVNDGERETLVRNQENRHDGNGAAGYLT